MPTAELDIIRGRLDVLESRMGGQERVGSARDQDVADIKSKLNSNDKLLQAIATTQSDHGKRLRNIETDVSGLKTGLSELKTDVSGLRTDVSGLKTDVSGLRGDMAKVKMTVQNTETGVKKILGLLEAKH